eukprot:gene6425-7084_t
MEGGIYPWKTQKIDCSSPSLDSYGKPLPPPPTGFVWERQADGSWILSKHTDVSPGPNSITLTSPSVIEHVVMPEDTLQGLCLRYRVSAVDLRRANLFSGNNFHFKKTLRIPLVAGSIIQPQLDSPEVKLQLFVNATGEGRVEARLYLEDHNWDVDKAIKAWKEDENWNNDHQEASSSFAADVSTHSEMVAPYEVLHHHPHHFHNGERLFQVSALPILAPIQGVSVTSVAVESAVREVAPLLICDSCPITYVDIDSSTALAQPLLL